MPTSLISLNWFIHIVFLLLINLPIVRNSPFVNDVHLTFQTLLAAEVQSHQEEGKNEEKGAEGVKFRE